MVFSGVLWVGFEWVFLFLIASASPVIQFEVAIKIAHEVYLGSFKITFLRFQMNTTLL